VTYVTAAIALRLVATLSNVVDVLKARPLAARRLVIADTDLQCPGGALLRQHGKLTGNLHTRVHFW
jgi:hypothetical protein